MKKIAFIGIRGMPVVYSGFESFVEDLINNINGFKFYVYNRHRYVQVKTYRKVTLIYIPTIYSYKFETFIHSFLSTLHATLFLKPSLIFYLGVGNAPFLLLPKLLHIQTIINVDGMDWDREKWGKFGKFYLSFCACISTKLADTIVTDSLYSKNYYKKKYHKETLYVPYMMGGYYWKEKIKVLKKYEVTKGNYYIWAGRLVPDNHLEDLLLAFMSTQIDMKLIIVGSDNYQTTYLKKIIQLIQKDVRIIQTGFLPRDEYLTLIKNAYVYVETKQSGGTHPTLLDGLTHASIVICNDFEANKKIAGNKTYYYKNRSVSELKKLLLSKLTSYTHQSYQDKIEVNDNNVISTYQKIFSLRSCSKKNH